MRKKISKADMRRAIAMKIKDISVEEFVTSTTFGDLISAGAKAILDAHNVFRRIAFDVSYHPEYGWVAYTDNQKCAVNAGSNFFLSYAGNPIEEIAPVYNYVLGAVFHEMGHVVYTDFDNYEKAYTQLNKELSKGKFVVKKGCTSLYPKQDLTRVKGFIKACHDSHYFAWMPYCKIVGTIFNIVEDGRIEDALLRNDHCFGGYANGLRKLREKQHTEATLSPDTEDNLNAYMNGLLNYAKYHDAKSVSTALQDAIPLVDKALVSRDFSELFECCKALFVIGSRYLDMEIPPEDESNTQQGETQNSEGESGDQNGTSSGQSNGQSNGQSSGDSSGSSACSSAGNGEEDAEGEPSDGNAESDSSNKDEEDAKEDSSGNGSSKSKDDQLEEEQKKNEQAAKEVCDSLDDNSSYTSMPSISGNAPRSLDEEATPNTTVSLDSLESALKDIAEEKAVNEERKARREQCKKFAVNGGSVTTKLYEAESGSSELYHKIADENASIIKGTAREIKRYLETDMRTGKKKRNYGGKNFNASKVCRNDFKYFSDTSKQRDVPEIAIELLIDQSGSMSGSRIQKAKESAIILYEMFSQIENMDIAVIGHTSCPRTNYSSSEITRFVDFGRKIKSDKYKLMEISAGGCNFDTIALPYAVNALLTEPADKRILFFICDGLPNCAETNNPAKELTEIADDACKKGIDMYILGLGEDSPQIQDIYKNQRFIDISDPKEMPRKLAQLIKKAYQ